MVTLLSYCLLLRHLGLPGIAGNTVAASYCRAIALLRLFLGLLRLLADVSEDTSIYVEDVAVNGVRSLGSKEYCWTTELRRVEPTACRSLCTDERESNGWRLPSG